MVKELCGEIQRMCVMHYNDATLGYNNSVQRFPGVIFAGIYGKKVKEYLKIPVEARAVPKVDF